MRAICLIIGTCINLQKKIKLLKNSTNCGWQWDRCTVSSQMLDLKGTYHTKSTFLALK